MPAATLADLRTPQTQDVIKARLIAALGFPSPPGRGLPTDAWTPTVSGGPENTTLDMIAGTLASLLGAKMAQAVGGRFLDLATGDLLAYLALHFYQLAKNPATFTIQNIRLSSVVAAPSNSFEPGEVWVRSEATGNRYVNLDHIDLPPGSTLGVNARFQAELPGSSYADPAETITTMVTSPAGVSCTNLGGFDYNPAHQTGSSTGKVLAVAENPDHTGNAVYDSIRIRIDTDGDIGTALFRYSVDGGVSWLPSIGATPVSPTFTIDAPPPNTLDGAVLYFTNGTTPSFLAGSIFTVFLADTILQQGADAESDDALRARCRSRWPSLSLVPTEGLVRLWAEQASPEITKVSVDADANVPGGMLITLAGPAGPATAAAMIAVSDYVLPRLLGWQGVPSSAVAGSPAETAQVRSAVPRQITPAGRVDVARARVAAVQQASDIAWLAYLRGLPLGGTVVLAELEDLLMDAGATNFDSILLNAVNQNVVLGPTEVAVAADGTSLTSSLTWRPV